MHCYLPNMTASDPSIERRLEMVRTHHPITLLTYIPMCACMCVCVQLSMDDVDDVTCVTFVLRGEDHTLGNALRYIIMKK